MMFGVYLSQRRDNSVMLVCCLCCSRLKKQCLIHSDRMLKKWSAQQPCDPTKGPVKPFPGFHPYAANSPGVRLCCAIEVDEG